MNQRLDHLCPPLLPLVISLAAGICAGTVPVFSPAWFLAAGTAFFLIPVYSFFLGSSNFLILLCTAASIWGGVSMARIQTPLLPGHHIAGYTDGSEYRITGIIESFTRHYPHKRQVVLACTAIGKKNKPGLPCRGRILLNIYGSNRDPGLSGPRFGDRIQVAGRLRPIRNFANPGGYDYKANMRFKGIFGALHVNAGAIGVTPRNDLDFMTRLSRELFRKAESLRNRFWQKVTTLGGEDRAGAAGVLTALVTGKKQGLDRETRDGFAKAGLSHILAISGFHLSLVALGFFFLFSRMLNRCHFLVVRGLASKWAGMITLIPLAGYALFTGFSPSTQRALIMVAVFMVSLLGEREKDPMNALCLAGFTILALDPDALFSISFQLSFTAVCFIILGLGRMGRRMPKNRIFAGIAGMALVTAFAGIGTFPLIAHYFNMVSFVQILSNLTLVPVLGFVCLPLGLAGLGLLGLSPAASTWILDLSISILDHCTGLIHWLAGMEWTWARVVTPNWAQVFLIYLFFMAIYLVGITRKKTAIAFMVIVTGAGAVSTAISLKQRFFQKGLTVTVLDVGQGNATLVKTPGGRTILIDGGGFPGRSGFDPGRFVVAPFLWRNWILSLDGLVLTHPQADHMGGLAFIMDNFKVNQWFRNRDQSRSKTFETLIRLAREKNIPQDFPGEIPRVFTFGKATLTLAPGNKDKGAKDVSRDLNNNSLVFRLAYGDFSMIFPGDIERPRETRLAEDGNMPLVSRVLLAPHHGSKGSSSKIFLDKIRPEGVIVSCGYANRYGFPHAETLSRYRDAGACVFRTDFHGAVIVTASGKGYEINTCRGD